MDAHTEIEKMLQKAAQSVEAADDLLQNGYAGFAVSRAYYAMFYSAEALLLKQNLSFSKHGAVIAAFGEHFIKAKIFDPKFHRYLREAFDQRLVGDYDVMNEISPETARATIKNAKEFIEEVKNYLRTRKPSN